MWFKKKQKVIKEFDIGKSLVKIHYNDNPNPPTNVEFTIFGTIQKIGLKKHPYRVVTSKEFLIDIFNKSHNNYAVNDSFFIPINQVFKIEVEHSSHIIQVEE